MAKQGRQFTYNVTMSRVLATIVAVEILVTHSECVSLALIPQHSKRMSHITLPSVACLALPYYSILSPKRHEFREKKVIGHKV